MSRAFVKEDDGAPDKGIARLETQGPNYVTPMGLHLLREQLAAAQRTQTQRDVEYLQRRIQSAAVIDPKAARRNVVSFGATVTIELDGGVRQAFTIVGEDQADPVNGTISWNSPLGQALLENRIGNRTTWRRPAGDVALRIVAIDYGE